MRSRRTMPSAALLPCASAAGKQRPSRWSGRSTELSRTLLPSTGPGAAGEDRASDAKTGKAMISNWLSAALARRNIHYGWVMVAVTFLTALITAGTVGAPGVFIVPLQREFGWSTAEISSALSIRFILFGLMAPFAVHNCFGV